LFKKFKIMKKEQVWLPLQTVYNKELLVGDYLKEQGIEYYIPMTYELRDMEDSDECCRVLVPAIHNLLFVRHSYDNDWCRKFAVQAPLPLYFMKKERNGTDFCTVSEQDMQNFMRATDPEIQGTRFIDSEKLRGKRSVPVRVVRRGPLYGVTGKFLRYGGRHYIAIEMPHSTALLKVSFTWCEIVVDQ